MSKPTVFIGSSTEQLPTAQALATCLGDNVEATLWNEPGLFEQNSSIFGGLLKAADTFDFAVFVFDADDAARVRQTRVKVVRDNVLFEFGLFTGRIGRGRTFRISVEGTPDTHVPTDLAGIVSLTFQRPSSKSAAAAREALASVCNRLRADFERLGRRSDHEVDEVDLVATRILCLASHQYAEERFAEDIHSIQRRFARATIESAHGVDAEGLMDRLSGQRWDIIHLAMYVDTQSGDLIVPKPGSAPSEHNAQRLPMRGAADLIERCGARLIVIVTCDSLVLAARLARVTNAIAGHKPIDVRAALDWSAVFYRFLSEGCSLTEAFNRAQLFTDPGMLLLAKRDFRLTVPA